MAGEKKDMQFGDAGSSHNNNTKQKSEQPPPPTPAILEALCKLKIKPHRRLHVAAISLTGDEGSSSPMSFLGK